jgi:endothelin-converting enzyme
MGFAAGRYFANITFGGDSREKGTKVITDIIKAFKHSLDDLEWMDEKSAHAAAEKVPYSAFTLIPGWSANIFAG